MLSSMLYLKYNRLVVAKLEQNFVAITCVSALLHKFWEENLALKKKAEVFFCYLFALNKIDNLI